MNTRRVLATGGIALLAASTVCTTAFAERPDIDMDVPYSATRIIETGRDRIEQRYFHHSATTNRMETELQGQQSIMIMRGDRNLMWTIMPQERMYMEITLDTASVQASDMPDLERWQLQELGRESLNGLRVTKYRAIAPEHDDSPMEGYMWITDDGIPVRMELTDGKDRVVMELRDLVVAAQPPALFEPPAGYQRLAIGGGATGLLDGLKGAQPTPTHGSAAEGVPGSQGEPGLMGELATEAVEEAKQTTRNEVKTTVRDSVRKGLRGLLPGKR